LPRRKKRASFYWWMLKGKKGKNEGRYNEKKLSKSPILGGNTKEKA